MRLSKVILKTSLVLATVSLLIASPVQADARGGNGEIGFDLGYMEWDAAYPSSGTGRGDLRLGYHLGKTFQLEAELGVARGTDSTLATAFLNGVFNFHSGDALMPYFLLGGGVAYAEIGDLDDTGPAAQLMGGARAFGPQGRVGLRLEAGVIWEDTFENESVHGMITVGFTFVLGQGKHGHNPTPKAPTWSSAH
jgi:hypothetical protein